MSFDQISPFRSAFDVFDPFLDCIQLEGSCSSKSREDSEEPPVADVVENIISQLQPPAEATPAAANNSGSADVSAAASAPVFDGASHAIAPAKTLVAINAIPPTLLIDRQCSDASVRSPNLPAAAREALDFVQGTVRPCANLRVFYTTVQTRLGQMICLFAGFVYSYDANFRRAAIEVAEAFLPGPAGSVAAAVNVIANYHESSEMARVQTGIHDAEMTDASAVYKFSEAVARALAQKHQNAIGRVQDPAHCKKLAIVLVKRIACKFSAMARQWSKYDGAMDAAARIDQVVATAISDAAPSHFGDVWRCCVGETFLVRDGAGGVSEQTLSQLLK